MDAPGRRDDAEPVAWRGEVGEPSPATPGDVEGVDTRKSPLDRFAPDLRKLERRVRRMETDSRLHMWEWLQRDDGRLLKTDALDHHAAHDLVGCQDVAWDVAGARVELDLSPTEMQDLCAGIEHETGRAVDPGLIAFSLPCYLAFQTGYYALAADALAGWPDEAARLRAASGRYAGRLQDVLTGHG